MGAEADDRARHPAGGHRAHAAQSDGRGHLLRRRQRCAPGTRSRRTRRSSSAAWPRSMPPSPNTPTCRSAGSIDYLEESGQLDNTLIFYCADNGASGEGSPNGSVNENRFFNGYPDDIKQNLAMIDKLGSPDTYNHYPTGWAVAFSTPYRMFKRYSRIRRRHRRSAGHPLAEGHQGEGRGAPPVPPLHRHRADHSRLLRHRDARRGRRREADAAGRRVDALLASTTPRRRRRRRRSTTRCSARAASGTRAGRPRPSTARCPSTWAISTRTAGSCSTPTRTAPRRTISPTSTPRRSRSWPRSGWREAKKYNVLPLNDLGIHEFHELEFKAAPPDERPLRLLSRARPRSPRPPPPARSASRSRFSPRSSSPAIRRASSSRRARASAATRCSSRTASSSSSTTSSASRPSSASSADAPAARQAHRRRGVHQGVDRQEPRSARQDDAVRRRQGGRQRPNSGRRPATTRSAAKGCASATTAATPSARNTSRSSPSPAAGSSR